VSDLQTAAVKRGLRTFGALAIAFVLSYIAGPDGADLLGDNQAVFVAVVTPLLTAVDKAIRYTP
jgi:hypothetical protein